MHGTDPGGGVEAHEICQSNCQFSRTTSASALEVSLQQRLELLKPLRLLEVIGELPRELSDAIEIEAIAVEEEEPLDVGL
ncbi:MAG TPA: hypothetical protein VLF66_06895, partial [Thermoanaerobaculia bacterium]|nr:hypothetical protein [Thermoanaerobaculia bacterium]